MVINNIICFLLCEVQRRSVTMVNKTPRGGLKVKVETFVCPVSSVGRAWDSYS